MAHTTLIRNARVLTIAGAGAGARRGAEAMNDAGVLEKADVLISRAGGADSAGVVQRVAPAIQLFVPADREIDAAGRVLMPAFVDCHTHACFAGDRLDEWQMKRRGAAYMDILRAGGGIMSTVRAVRAATRRELTDLLRERLALIAKAGTGVVEIKSGYGLTLEHELKMLRVIADAATSFPGAVVPTALLGHAIDPDVPAFIERTIGETLDAVHEEFPGIAVDAFCEQGAWPAEATARLLRRALDLGHPVRVHADQFTSLGMTRQAVSLGAVSVDHLEASTADDLDALAASETFAVGLPACGFHVDGRYADLRRLIDRGAKVSIATNFNPGSAPTWSMPAAMALAVRRCGLTPAEAIIAGTANAASLLGLSDRGRIVDGASTPLLLLRHRDERTLALEFGVDPIAEII
jgi:imidazolonepropionase